VHPAKTEVRFVRGTIVHDLIRDAVRAAIGSAKAAATSFVEKKFDPVSSAPAETAPTTDRFVEKPPPISREELRAAFRLQAPQPIQQPRQQKIDLGFSPPLETEPVSVAVAREPEMDLSAPTPETIEPEVSISVERASLGNRIGCLG